MRADKPDVPNLAAVPGPEAPQPSKALVPVAQPEEGGDGGNVAPRERYWTEERIMRLGFMLLVAMAAVGLVVTLSRSPGIEYVPWLPWAIGLAVVAVPAWKAYSELLEEQKGRRIREEQAANAYGITIGKEPTSRHAG